MPNENTLNHLLYTTKAFYLSAKSGQLCCLHYIPKKKINAHVLIFSPFAEELNRSRHLISLMCKQFAENNLSVLLVDLYATGDSEGDFINARWNIWKQDMSDAIAYLNTQAILPINFLSIRLGTLLALDLLNTTKLSVNNFIAWQPVFNSSKFIQQFLRIHLATHLNNKESDKTVAAIKQNIYKNNSLEIAGYELSAQLMNDILSVNFCDFKIDKIKRLLLIQMIASSNGSFSSDIQNFILQFDTNNPLDFYDGLDNRHKINIKLQQGASFWQNYEIKDLPELRDLTLLELLANEFIH